MCFRNLFHYRILKQMGRLDRMLKIHFHIALRSKTAVRSNSDTFLIDEVDKWLLDKVRMVFDLEGCGPDLGIAEKVEDGCTIEVAQA